MFLKGADGKPFQFRYDERKKERILRDLKEGSIELTAEDIGNIPSTARFMDIYVLLVEYGYSDIKTNVGLYSDCCRYLGQFMHPAQDSPMCMYSTLARKIIDVLIVKDESSLRSFLHEFIIMVKYFPGFQGEYLTNRIVPITFFLSSLLDSNAARKISWEHKIQSVVNEFESKLGPAHLVTSYVKEVMVFEFHDLYQLEKQKQKLKVDALKEELMAMTWHPDRFQDWCLDEEEKAENRMLFA
jgi:hypothetical protein